MTEPPTDPLASLRDRPVDDWRARLDHMVERATDTVPAPLLVGALLLLAVAIGALAFVLVRPPGATTETRPAGGVAASSLPFATTTTKATEVVVDVGGAVSRPGVYRLPPSSRVADLIDGAGGLAPDADRARINLAAPLVDGSRVYVPRVGESDAPPLVGAESPSGPGDGATATPAAPLDLNTASEAQLETLPGIGPSTAAAIVDYRSSHGPFRSVDGLLEVRGIGPAKLEQLRDLVRV